MNNKLYIFIKKFLFINAGPDIGQIFCQVADNSHYYVGNWTMYASFQRGFLYKKYAMIDNTEYFNPTNSINRAIESDKNDIPIF